jgi:hypothetical protein
MQPSENRAEDQFASAAGADGFPAGSSIESLRSRAGIGRERRGAMSGTAQRIAGGLEKSAADPRRSKAGSTKSAQIVPSRVSPAEKPRICPPSSQTQMPGFSSNHA